MKICSLVDAVEVDIEGKPYSKPSKLGLEVSVILVVVKILFEINFLALLSFIATLIFLILFVIVGIIILLRFLRKEYPGTAEYLFGNLGFEYLGGCLSQESPHYLLLFYKEIPNPSFYLYFGYKKF